MDFANERYVRLYVRDTMTWKRLGWDGQTMLMHLLRKVDRSGVIDIGDAEPWESGVMLCGAPEEQARRGVARMLELGVIVHDADRLVFPRFIEGNETPQSDAQRVREHREREKLKRAALKRNVTTDGNETLRIDNAVKRADTAGNSVPCRTEPSVPSSSSENNSNPSSAAAVSSTREDFSGSRVVRLPAQSPDYERAAAAAGWLSRVTGQEAYSTNASSKHYAALLDLAAKPEAQKTEAARVLKAEGGKPGIGRYLTPQHVVDNWRFYANGEAPGRRQAQPVAAKPAEPSEVEKLSAKLKELERAERACLYDEDDKKQRIKQRKQEIYAQIQRISAEVANG